MVKIRMLLFSIIFFVCMYLLNMEIVAADSMCTISFNNEEVIFKNIPGRDEEQVVPGSFVREQVTGPVTINIENAID